MRTGQKELIRQATVVKRPRLARLATTWFFLVGSSSCAANSGQPSLDRPTSTVVPNVVLGAEVRTASTTSPTASPTPTAASTSTVKLSATTATEQTVPKSVAPAVDPLKRCIDGLDVRTMAALVTWPGAYGGQLQQTLDEVKRLGLGGIILMTAPQQGEAVTLHDIRDNSRFGLRVAVDEEGGKVQRLKGYGVLPAASVAAKTMSPAQVEEMVTVHAAKLAKIGIDVVLGPVVDVAPVDGLGPLGDRVMSSDPQKVADIASAYVRGWQSSNILPVLKHFPGHGTATADTHHAFSSTPDMESLMARDFVPYQQLANSGAAVMIGHLTIPGYSKDSTRPASLDRRVVVDLLQDRLGVRPALVISDALEMQAIAANWSISAAAVQSLAAGVDIVIFSGASGAERVIAEIVSAVADGRLLESRLREAVERYATTNTAQFLAHCPA